MRSCVYRSVESEFHDKDMNWINESHDNVRFFIISDSKQIMGFTELSVRNIVDDCIGLKKPRTKCGDPKDPAQFLFRFLFLFPSAGNHNDRRLKIKRF